MEDKDNELLELWKVQIEDLRYTKRQQWLVAFYGILIQAGIIKFLQIIVENGSIGRSAKWLFTSSTIVILSIVLWLFYEYKRNINGYRKNIKSYTEKTTSKTIFEIYYNQIAGNKDYVFKSAIPIIHIFANILAAAFVIVFIWVYC